jgi:hypothetical protein
VDTAVEKFDITQDYLVRQDGEWTGSAVDASLHRLKELLTPGAKFVVGCGRCGLFTPLDEELQRDGSSKFENLRLIETVLVLNNNPHSMAIVESAGEFPINDAEDSLLNTVINLKFVNQENYTYDHYAYELGRDVPVMMAIRMAFGHNPPGRANEHMYFHHAGDTDHRTGSQYSEFMFFMTYDSVMGICAESMKYIAKEHNVEDELKEYYEFDRRNSLDNMTGLVDVVPEFAQQEPLRNTCLPEVHQVVPDSSPRHVFLLALTTR